MGRCELPDFNDLQTFDQDGVLLKRNVLSKRRIDKVNREFARLDACETQPVSVVAEEDGKTIRARHGDHLSSPLLNDLARLTCLRETAERILQSKVYVYQFKMNSKAALTGAGWPWHEDLVYWKNEDGLLTPQILTIGIFLSDIGPFSGPLKFLTGSHRRHDPESCISTKQARNGLRDFVGEDLRDTVGRERLSELWTDEKLLSAEGEAGTLVVFDGRVLHCSPDNISPFDRKILFITYSAITNVPIIKVRPEFLSARQYLPLQALVDEDEF
jgi:ectoine hydroxylase